MKTVRKWLPNLTLLLIAVIIHFLSANTIWVEKYYSTGIYPYISASLMYLLGWLPFSGGDVFYGIIAIWLIYKIVQQLRFYRLKKITPAALHIFGIKLFRWLLLIYLFFNILWGVNYNRMGIASQLGLFKEIYTPLDLRIIDSMLLHKVNSSKRALLQKKQYLVSTKGLKEGSKDAYERISIRYQFLANHSSSIKPSLWGWLGNYLGFTGYYNPFTGEAQVNTTVPQFLQPFIFCHETAHQLGYAKEDEANFVGYLASIASPDTLFHYSAYLDLFLYTQRNLYKTDSSVVKDFASKLIPEVKADLYEWRQFNKRHKNPVEPIVRLLYSTYLINNQQPAGALSYDEVTGLLIAYYKKFGKI